MLLLLGLAVLSSAEAGCTSAVDLLASRSRQIPVQQGTLRVPVRMPALIEAYSAPLTTNFDATELGTRRASESVIYLQEPFSGFGLSLSFGDVGVESIARSSGITEVTHVDYRIVNVLGIFIQFEVIVHGRGPRAQRADAPVTPGRVQDRSVSRIGWNAARSLARGAHPRDPNRGPG